MIVQTSMQTNMGACTYTGPGPREISQSRSQSSIQSNIFKPFNSRTTHLDYLGAFECCLVAVKCKTAKYGAVNTRPCKLCVRVRNLHVKISYFTIPFSFNYFHGFRACSF